MQTPDPCLMLMMVTLRPCGTDTHCAWAVASFHLIRVIIEGGSITTPALSSVSALLCDVASKGQRQAVRIISACAYLQSCTGVGLLATLTHERALAGWRSCLLAKTIQHRCAAT